MLSIIARGVLTLPVSTIGAFSAGGIMVSKKRCNLSSEAIKAAIKAVVCLKYLNLADKRLHDYVREAALVIDTKHLKLSKHE